MIHLLLTFCVSGLADEVFPNLAQNHLIMSGNLFCDVFLVVFGLDLCCP